MTRSLGMPAPRRLVAIVGAFVLAFSTVFIAAAASTHSTDGDDGSHSSGTHSVNPGHLKVVVGSPLGDTVTSGGRYHDACGATVCFSVFGSDWALDLDADPGTNDDADLYLDYDNAGSGGAYATLPVDDDEDITVYAKVATAVGNLRNEPADPDYLDPACEYRGYDIKVSYTDTSGTPHNGLTIGRVWLIHQDNWQYATNATTPTNASRANPDGTGTIYYVDGQFLAEAYDDSGDCSTGPHVHLEVVSNHNWGEQTELHSSNGPDGYSGLEGITNHIHTGTGGGYNATGTISAGSDIGAVGGDRTDFYMN